MSEQLHLLRGDRDDAHVSSPPRSRAGRPPSRRWATMRTSVVLTSDERRLLLDLSDDEALTFSDVLRAGLRMYARSRGHDVAPLAKEETPA